LIAKNNNILLLNKISNVNDIEFIVSDLYNDKRLDFLIIDAEHVEIDKENLCIYFPYEDIEKVRNENIKNIKYGWMEIYPTYDNFITEIEILN
jgi:hypothetical protein